MSYRVMFGGRTFVQASGTSKASTMMAEACGYTPRVENGQLFHGTDPLYALPSGRVMSKSDLEEKFGSAITIEEESPYGKNCAL